MLDGSPPPVLASAAFSATGGQLYFDFGAPTDRGGVSGSLGCGTLVDFVGVESATCKWSSSFRLVVTLDYRALVVPGDAVTVIAETIRKYCAPDELCDCWPTAEAQAVLVAPPSEPLVPSRHHTPAYICHATKETIINMYLCEPGYI